MSIIEKAVSKLGNEAERTKEDGSGPGSPAGGQVPNTVQKATDGLAAHGGTVKQAAACLPAQAVQTQARDREVSFRASKSMVNIPFDDLHSAGILTPGVPRSAIAEEFRTIKRPLLKNIAGDSTTAVENANLVMVTSALQDEGKTFTSINLALSIAMEMDKTVLYVDADISKASAGAALGVPRNSPGLIDVLENKGVGLGDVILHTNMEKLRILPAGNVHTQSNELLASANMRELMQELSHRYADRVIVFDSPPLLLTNEAGVLANLMGQIVFVVRADETPQQAVTEALEHIGEDKMVGMVLNRARARRMNLFSYGYGYGYGYGGRDSVAGVGKGAR